MRVPPFGWWLAPRSDLTREVRDGRVVSDTAGMLPEADIAFLDEVFLGSTAILNTLLGILNKRQFRRGETRLNYPLRIRFQKVTALMSAIAYMGLPWPLTHQPRSVRLHRLSLVSCTKLEAF